MALGTPTDRGTAKRFVTSDNLTSNTWTPAANEFIWCFVQIPTSATIPDSISGHDGGGAWTQIGTTLTINSKAYSLWGAFSGSSPSSGVVTVARATSWLMTCLFGSVTGADVSGTIANALVQRAQGSGYVTTQSLTLTGATDTTVGFWGADDNVTITAENTQINNVAGEYNTARLVSDYKTVGDTSPSATNGIARYSAYHAFELKVASSGVTPQIVSPHAMRAYRVSGRYV